MRRRAPRTAFLTSAALAASSLGLAAAVPLAAPAAAAGFGDGDLVVLRVGAGDAALSSAATAVFLDEYRTDGTPAQSIPLPTAASGAAQALTMSGSATSEGALALSADGKYLTLGGYAAAPGTAGIAGSTVPRVVARVDGSGTVDTTTTVTDAFSANNIRGAASADGAAFYAVGANGGVRRVQLGASTSIAINTTAPTNLRAAQVAGGNLYVSTGSGTTGVYQVGSGLPATGGQTPALVAAVPSPYGFVLLDRSAAVPGPDTLYVADDSGAPNGGVVKFSSDGTTWTARGSFRPSAGGLRGLTGRVGADGSVQLYGTSSTATQLLSITDTAAFDAAIAGTASTVATAAQNTVFRGVAFAPQGSAPATAPAFTTQPAGTSVPSGGTATLTVTATGTAPLALQWYRGEAGDTANPVGTGAASFTTPPLTATTSYWVRVTNGAGSADSATAMVTVQDVQPGNTAPTVTPATVQPIALTVGDPTGPPAARTVTVADVESAASALAVTVTSSDPAVATGSASGTGATRTLDLTPVGAGLATLTVTVSDGELSASSTLTVAVAAARPARTLNHYGISDASAATDLGDGAMVLADDETNTLRVYSRTASRYPSGTLDVRAAGLALRDADVTREIDIEASARSGNTVYWIGSQGQNSSGNTRLNRQELFTTTVTGTGAAATLALGGSYQHLRDDLVAWDTANGGTYGLAAAAARAPESDPTGFNLEGAEFAPDGTTLLLALRGPLTSSGKALILPVTNVAALVAANPTTGVTAQVGTPIEVDLGGRGIRDLRRNASGQYLLVAGPSGAGTGAAGEFRLYAWDGVAGHAPLPRQANLDALAQAGSIESIVSVPDPLTSSSTVQLVTDSGDTAWYGDGTANKDLATPEFRKVTSASVAVGAGPACSDADTAIGAVEGTTDVSPKAGQTVTVQGTVVADDEGPSPALRGFYLQDAGDGDPATSDGIFVFNNNANSVSNGQVVQVTGTVSEFQGQTQLTPATGGIELCGSTAAVTPADVTLPLASADALERYEGMLVRFHQTLSVTEHFQLGRFGQVVLSSGGRLRQPTALYPASDPRAAALQAANNLNRVILDDDLQNQNPDPIVWGRNGQPLSASNTLRGGDTVTDATGVLTYTWAGNAASGNAWRLRPLGSLGGQAQFTAVNARPTAAPAVGGTVKVAGANLLNLFNTFGTTACSFGVGGPVAECRGAADSTEFERQIAKEVAALTTLDAAVVGATEIENDGYGPDSAVQTLVDRLNAKQGPGTWAFINPDGATNVVNSAGTDAIKPVLLYQPGKVTPVVGKTFTDHAAAATFERIPVAQTFTDRNGATFTVVVNHFKSKGSCPTAAGDPNADAGDGQGCWNVRRTQQAQELVRFLRDDVIPAAGDPDVLIVGDLNSYAGEAPIRALEAGGYVNLVKAYGGDEAYSYVFDGQWGYLDHALASPSLRPQTTGAGDFHINADEPSVLDYNTDFKSAGQVASLYAPDPYRGSDHDSVLVGLAPPAAKVATTTTLTSSANPATYGSNVKFTATVTAAVPSNTVPSGTVQFKLAGLPLGAPVKLVNGVATSPSVPAILPAAPQITATYAGDTRFTGSSASFTQEVVVGQPPLVSPVDGGTAKAGSTVPIRFKLTDGAGKPIPDLLAIAMTLPGSACLVTVEATGVQSLSRRCATYDLLTDTFRVDWKTSAAPIGQLGAVTVTAHVGTIGSGVVRDRSSAITLVK